MKVIAFGEEFLCARAVKGKDYVELYGGDGTCLASFSGVSDFSGYRIEGGAWSDPVPAEADDINGMLVDHELRLSLLEIG